MQALEAKIATVQACAAKIIKNESTAAVEDRDGVLQPVEDGGSRDILKSLVVDVLARLKPKQAANVLGKLDAELAAKLTTKMAEAKNDK